MATTKPDVIAEWREMAIHCREYAAYVSNMAVTAQYVAMADTYDRFADELAADTVRWGTEVRVRWKSKLSEALNAHRE